jgi:hypothetical protein
VSLHVLPDLAPKGVRYRTAQVQVLVLMVMLMRE